MDLFLTAATVGSANGFCTETANVWQIVGYVLLVFKIVIPVLLIIFGMIDLGKAVIASKDDEIKKATKGLAMRAIAAVAVFLIPTIISFLMGVVGGFSGDKGKDDFDVCSKCLVNPGKGDCATKANAAWDKETK